MMWQQEVQSSLREGRTRWMHSQKLQCIMKQQDRHNFSDEVKL